MPIMKCKCSHPGCNQIITSGSRCDSHSNNFGRPKKDTRKSQRERGYDRAWEKLRKQVMEQYNWLCAECLKSGIVTPAVDLHHVVPFSGIDDPLRLDQSNLQPLCKECHSAITRGEETISGLMLPSWLEDATGSIIICGPPGTGKSFLAAKKNIETGKPIIDLDAIHAELTGTPLYHEQAPLRDALKKRNSLIHEYQKFILVGMYPKASDRQWWNNRGAEVILLNPGLHTCIKRINNDFRRPNKEEHINAVRRWFREFTI